MKTTFLTRTVLAPILVLAIRAPLAAQQPPSPSPFPAPAAEGETAVLIGAGDIAACDHIEEARRTAAIVEKIPGTVFTLGDNAYPSGTAEQFTTCYAPTWGRFKDRTRPAPGNHDYRTAGAGAYFAYFGKAAGDPTKGYYSYDLGAWHVLVVNSNCKEVGGCERNSPQETWVRVDLAAHPTLCTIAMWHHPRFSSAEHGDDPSMRFIWKDLYDAGADVVLAGHDHTYERFAPMDAGGKRDEKRGIREFVAGTGGRSLYKFVDVHATSEVRENQTYGVLKLTLRPDSYDWQFLPAEGDFKDEGTGKCH
ncbi:MAG TPA: metallophosphoesterase [Thermoanaerobaculia bacterium]